MEELKADHVQDSI
jgi:hypothetical protein